jgi:hypothetical protein
MYGIAAGSHRRGIRPDRFPEGRASLAFNGLAFQTGMPASHSTSSLAEQPRPSHHVGVHRHRMGRA